MPNNLINIRTNKFTKKEIQTIEDLLKAWNYNDFVDIVYVGEGDREHLDVSFTLEQDDLGEFIWLIFGCGHEFVYMD